MEHLRGRGRVTYEDAAAAVTSIRDRHPDLEYPAAVAAGLRLPLQDPNGALSAADGVLERFPSSRHARIIRAAALHQLGRDDEASTAIEGVISHANLESPWSRLLALHVASRVGAARSSKRRALAGAGPWERFVLIALAHRPAYLAAFWVGLGCWLLGFAIESVLALIGGGVAVALLTAMSGWFCGTIRPLVSAVALVASLLGLRALDYFGARDRWLLTAAIAAGVLIPWVRRVAHPPQKRVGTSHTR